ncbi:TetR/AcrR family transcriptional regulator [Lichenihabitans psoromatis]|uniref:TetR/AcrR family transcriptional regulator n=1 Tax=Lichenihabitans psoromatis TaxID=2528642 RepID=UPI001036B2D9|nr:TetR/AcrR family transcriptional regulator [Lichenihabitans psoromatis]
MSLVSPPQRPSDDGPKGRDEGAKRRQIVDGAREVFLQDGFDAASMNEIARRAGVSKGTLYVYFDSKEALFEALIREDKREQAEQMCRFDHRDADVATTLQAFGERLLERMLRPSSVAHLRIVASVAAKFPSIGRAFYEAGPEIGQTRLGDYLRAQVDKGVISIDDPVLAGGFFCDMCKHLLLPVLLCVQQTPTSEDIARHVTAVVAVFMRAFPLTDAKR